MRLSHNPGPKTKADQARQVPNNSATVISGKLTVNEMQLSQLRVAESDENTGIVVLVVASY